jgi:hypothetical protein
MIPPPLPMRAGSCGSFSADSDFAGPTSWAPSFSPCGRGYGNRRLLLHMSLTRAGLACYSY